MRYCMIIRKFGPAMQHYERKKKKKEKGKRERENRAVYLPAPYRGIQSKRTVYLGQLSPKGEFLCSIFNPFSFRVVEDAKP